MKEKIVFFSQYKLGGVQNYYRQIIANDPGRCFDKLWIQTCDVNDTAALPTAPFNVCEEKVFEYGNTGEAEFARLAALLPPNPVLVMTNFHLELQALLRYPPKTASIVHVCHDDFFLDIAAGFAHIIDAFVAHNYTYYEKLQLLLPGRTKDIYFLPYGIAPSPFQRQAGSTGPLKIFFLARFDRKKGIYDLFLIDDLLKEQQIAVQWTLVGDGPEKKELEAKAAQRSNFSVQTIRDTADVFKEAARQDVFILPSYLDGLPVALLETMSAGLVPVISEFNSGIRRVVDAQTGYVLPVGDTKAFAATLAHLQANRHELDEKGQYARRRMLQEYDIIDRGKDYYNFFKQHRQLKKSNWYKYSLHISNSRFDFLKYTVKKQLKKVLGHFRKA